MSADVFSHIPLFAELSPSEREDLQELLRPRDLKPQEPIVWIGEAGDEFFIIERGHVVICYPDDKGQERTLAVLGPGHFFGELSLLDGGRRTATARAQTDGRLLVLGREAFHKFIKRHPVAATHILTVIGRRERENLDKLRGIQNANEVVEEQQTPVQKFAERVAKVFATEVFLVLNLIFICGWIILHTVLYDRMIAREGKQPWHFIDAPPTFFWLGFIITVEAIVLSMFVLNTQRRQAQRDAIKADLDYQVNRKAQLEIMHLHEKLDRLQAMIAEGKAPPALQAGDSAAAVGSALVAAGGGAVTGPNDDSREGYEVITPPAQA